MEAIDRIVRSAAGGGGRQFSESHVALGNVEQAMQHFLDAKALIDQLAAEQLRIRPARRD